LPLLRSSSAFVPEPKNRTRPAEPLPEPKVHDLPHFEAISQTHIPQLPSFVQIGFAFLPSLPGWQRQSLYLPQYASNQAPRQAALLWRRSAIALRGMWTSKRSRRSTPSSMASVPTILGNPVKVFGPGF
jgi:hypothetical protein